MRARALEIKPGDIALKRAVIEDVQPSDIPEPGEIFLRTLKGHPGLGLNTKERRYAFLRIVRSRYARGP